MGKDELGDIEWLVGCTSRERAAIRRRADLIDLPAGTVLIREGDRSRWFYALVNGDVSVTTDGNTVGRVAAGEPVNEVDVLRNEASAVTVTADTDVSVLVMGRREFLGMLDDTPGLARRLLTPHIPRVPATNRRPVLVPLPAA